jgi:signal transduction histidine kinase
LAEKPCTPASRNDASAAWLTRVPGAAELLRAAICRLSRLHALETAFQQTLETEKLSSLAELAAGAGHEINNPLAVISGRAQMLIRDERDPERRHALAAINAQALRVHEMIADMMLFARPPQPRFASVDVAEVVRRVIESLRGRAAEAQVELTSNLPPAPLLIQADATQLIVALRALCENSIEAIGHTGQIEITARLVGRSLTPDLRPLTPILELVVRDTGPGIPPEVRRHIFDPFYSGRPAGRGIGFGLSKCWRIVTNHGGTIAVVDNPEGGAVFTITLRSHRP